MRTALVLGASALCDNGVMVMAKMLAFNHFVGDFAANSGHLSYMQGLFYRGMLQNLSAKTRDMYGGAERDIYH
jgi:hypothetical protein